MLSTLRRLADLTLVEHALLLQLTALSLGLRVALATMPLPRLISLLPRSASSSWLSQIPFLHTRCTPDRLLTLVDLATTVSHGDGRCLPRSLLLFWLLHARQESVELCIGVGKHNTTLEGHAWIERDGIVWGDTRSFTNRYAPFLRLSA
jgi:hypothetical protein